MARKRDTHPAVRKPLIVAAGAVVGLVVLLYVVSTCVLGGRGDDGQVAAPPAPANNSSGVVDGASAGVATGGSVPTTGAATTTVKAPVNRLTDGGDNPFASRVGAAPAPVKVPAVNVKVPAADELLAKVHVWQLLELKDGKGTFLVDGKKVTGIALRKEIVKGYTFNSVTTAKCATVRNTKAAQAFVLCLGAAPFSA
jgi:hypothetical protein